jgi:hypothetical protein
MLDLYVYTINLGGQPMAALSLLTPEEVDRYGLVSEAVLGEVDPRKPDMTIDNFTANDDFLTLLHRIIAMYAPEMPVVQKQVANIENGPVYVVDRRTIDRAGGKPPFEDVLGWFAILKGELQLELYNPNPSYKLLSNHGPVQLDPFLEARLLEAIKLACERELAERSAD